MSQRIDKDVGRFREIVRGHVRKNLKKYITNSELIGKRGKGIVSIPVPEIELPHFKFGSPQDGVGQGDGEVGDMLGPVSDRGGMGGAGDQPGYHILEVEFTLEELAELLGENLELPRIQPKGKNNILGETARYTGLRRTGPEGLRHFKRTYREALRREIQTGIYNPDNPTVVPIHDDKRYRSWKMYPRPEDNAVIFYMMDVSGSMSDDKKNLVRLTAFWIDIWIRAHYKNVEVRYIVHDTNAHVVSSDVFYHITESGGTMISSAYKLCNEIIDREFPPVDWNIYAFHFSDGENYESDNVVCIDLLSNILLAKLNLFCYGQVQFAGWAPMAIVNPFAVLLDKENVVMAKIDSEDDIYTVIGSFLGKGL